MSLLFVTNRILDGKKASQSTIRVAKRLHAARVCFQGTYYGRWTTEVRVPCGLGDVTKERPQWRRLLNGRLP